jgi:hypothetical protein
MLEIEEKPNTPMLDISVRNYGGQGQGYGETPIGLVKSSEFFLCSPIIKEQLTDHFVFAYWILKHVLR